MNRDPKEVIDTLKDICADAYQYAGTNDAPVEWLDFLLEAAEGFPSACRIRECEAAVDQAIALVEYLEGHSKGAMAERVRTALDAKFAEQRRQYIERLRKIEAAALALINNGSTELPGGLIVAVSAAEFRALFDAIET